MYTNCSQFTLSDYQDSVIDNLINNIKENKLNHHHKINIDFETDLNAQRSDDKLSSLKNKDEIGIKKSTY
jgi:hypothetical protein